MTKPFEVVFLCSDFIVVDKMPGVVSQGAHSHSSDNNLLTALASRYPGESFYPVHRLDALTSGLLVVAKNSQAASELGQAFASAQVAKTYIALSDKKPKKKQGRIVGDMVKARNGCWKLAQTRTKPAVTRFLSTGLHGQPRLFLLYPTTGKTHQLRVALKSLGAAILGDGRYGGTDSDRLYLHAHQLEFNCFGKGHVFQSLPKTGEHFLTDAFLTMLQSLQQKAKPEPSASRALEPSKS